MRILIVTNYFWPENFRINDLAVSLVERRHDVTVLTGIPNYPEGKFFSGYGFFKKRTEVYRGVKVVRFPLIPRGKGGGLRLALNYFSSALMSTILAPFYCRDKYDVIFVFEISPVTVGLPAIAIKKLQSIPIIFWVLDLWPESLLATGATRSSMLIKLVRGLVRFIYSKCDQILVSSLGYVKNIEDIGGYRGEIGYLPNWAEPEYVVQREGNDAVLPDLPDGFRIMFAGNIGSAQDFPTVLAAAEKLTAYSDIHWVIIGDGRRLEWVKEQVLERNLSKQFHLLGRYPAETMPQFFAQADAMLITLKHEPIFALTVPGKLQSYMASGIPIIAGLDGEGSRVVEEAAAGLICPTENPVELAARVLELYQMSPEKRREMGERGRVYCDENFDRDKLFTQLETIMMDIVHLPNGSSNCGI